MENDKRDSVCGNDVPVNGNSGSKVTSKADKRGWYKLNLESLARFWEKQDAQR